MVIQLSQIFVYLVYPIQILDQIEIPSIEKKTDIDFRFVIKNKYLFK